ncbi:MAG TPA: ABC transporter ATP-binding protein [Chloroflexi bacterium]|nr:ABC transporter ATP-binding protein [Chloroflexota bacterium]
MAEPIIKLRDVNIIFERGLFLRKVQLRAVVNTSLDIEEGKILALVGESGCGKTTLGKVMVGLLKPSSGEVLYKGKDIWRMNRSEFREYRRNAQIVHQDSYAALNPVRTIYHSLSAPFLHYHLARNRRQAREKVAELLQHVGLTPPEQFIDKYPHQLSGGQRQRVVLARAVSLRPKLIVADEPVSMVDVSLRLSLLDLMHKLNEEFGIAFLYITHDLATARYFVKGGRIAVMYLGQLVETGKLGEIVKKPRHPYLQALLSAVPVPDPKLARTKRPLPLRSLEFPDPTKPPSGCRFHPRCPYAEDICAQEIPTLRPLDGRFVACHLAERIPEWHLL